MSKWTREIDARRASNLAASEPVVCGKSSEGFAELVTHNTDGITDVTVGEPGRPYRQVGSNCCLRPREYAVVQLDNGNLEVDWSMGRTVNETKTFILSYTVEGAIRRYAAGNEFQSTVPLRTPMPLMAEGEFPDA